MQTVCDMGAIFASDPVLHMHNGATMTIKLSRTAVLRLPYGKVPSCTMGSHTLDTSFSVHTWVRVRQQPQF